MKKSFIFIRNEYHVAVALNPQSLKLILLQKALSGYIATIHPRQSSKKNIEQEATIECRFISTKEVIV